MQEQTHERAPMIVVKPPGPRSRELLAKQSKLETKAVIYPKAFPFAIDSANGATVKDVDGNLYIDWVSGISVLNLGTGTRTSRKPSEHSWGRCGTLWRFR